MKSKSIASSIQRFSTGVPAMVLCFILLLLPLAPAAADDAADLVTDRPDQTESAVIVPPGTTQIELGWLFTRDDSGGVRTETHQVPGTLARISLAERVELRVGWSGYVTADVRFGRIEVDADGIGDADLGAKILLREEQGRTPQMALLVSTSVPVGDDELTSDRFDPQLRLAFSNTLSETVGLGYNVGLAFASEPGDDGEIHTLSSVFYTVALGFGLGDRLGAFVEVFGDFPASASGDSAHSFDGGFTYLVRDNVQLDLFAGLGLSDAADDWFLGLGISVRFPG